MTCVAFGRLMPLQVTTLFGPAICSLVCFCALFSLQVFAMSFSLQDMFLNCELLTLGADNYTLILIIQ